MGSLSKGMSLLLLLLASCALFSQASRYPTSIKWINTDNGLKQLSVKYAIADDIGFLWLGTELGLYRYDGRNLMEVQDARYPNLSKQRITRMGKDILTGDVYFDTYPDAIQYVIRKNRIERLDPKKYWRNVIFTLGYYCYASSDPLVKQVFEQPQSDSFINRYALTLFPSAGLTKDYLYLPQLSDITVFDKKGKRHDLGYPSTINIVMLQFSDTLVTLDNGEVRGIAHGRLLPGPIRLDQRIKESLTHRTGPATDRYIFGSRDVYFIKHKGGIYRIRYRNRSLTTEFLFQAPSEDITSITYLASEELYAIGTKAHGLCLLKMNPFHTVLCPENGPNNEINYCYNVVPISDEEWYSPSGWKFNFYTGVLETEGFFSDSRNIRFMLPYKGRLYYEAQHELWNAATQKPDHDFRFKRVEYGFSVNLCAYTYHKKELYLVDDYSLYHLNGNAFETDPRFQKNFDSRTVNGLYSVNGRLIVPTTKGVYYYNEKTGKATVIPGLEQVNARYVKRIDSGRFWVGCYGDGLFVVTRNRTYKARDRNIALTTAHAIELDAQGHLWISTNDGLLVTPKAEALQKITSGQPLYCYRYSTNDGLLTNEFNGGGTNPSLHTKEGILGFPSMKGFVWFDPSNLPKKRFKSHILMDRVTVDNTRPIPLGPNAYRIPKEAGVIKLDFSYGYFYNRENLTIAYRFDTDEWTEINGNSMQIARYQPGRHELQIRITTHGFPEKTAVTQSFTFEFEERYYETALFWVFAVLMLVSMVYIAYLLGLRYQKRNAELLRRRIAEKTGELSDTVRELELSRNAVTQSLHDKDVLLKEVHHRVKNNLQLIISMLNIQARRKNFTDIYEFLKKGETRISSMALIHQSLYQSEESADKIHFGRYIDDLVSSINQTFENTDGRVAIAVDIDQILLNLSTAIPLGLIINELVTNSLKHAFPDNRNGVIQLQIRKTGPVAFELIVSDDGVGFSDEKRQHKSFGLELIQLLASQLRGHVRLESISGTRYTITFQEIDLPHIA